MKKKFFDLNTDKGREEVQKLLVLYYLKNVKNTYWLGAQFGCSFATVKLALKQAKKLGISY